MGEKTNDGTATHNGIKVPYGKDNSEFAGKASDERIPTSMGGSTSNLSHTLTGAEANQKQK